MLIKYYLTHKKEKFMIKKDNKELNNLKVDLKEN